MRVKKQTSSSFTSASSSIAGKLTSAAVAGLAFLLAAEPNFVEAFDAQVLDQTVTSVFTAAAGDNTNVIAFEREHGRPVLHAEPESGKPPKPKLNLITRKEKREVRS